MSKMIKIRDLTLRDGQQSWFATRMTMHQVERTLPLYKEARFYAMEVWGGAVPDSVMRFLNEDPWERLSRIKEQICDASKLTALSRGRNLFGYNPYPEDVIEGFIKHTIQTGIDILRIFDALNDLDNIKSSIIYTQKYGGIADGAICYTTDPQLEPKSWFGGLLKIKPKWKPVFTIEYFVEKAKEIERMGADMITIKDMAGLVDHVSAGKIIRAIKQNVNIPVDFHTHSTPGYGLASTLTAILNGADIIDTCLLPFAGGPAATAFEIIYLFCKKLKIETDVNIEVISPLSDILFDIRNELKEFDSIRKTPRRFDLQKDKLPLEIEKMFDIAIESVEKEDFDNVLKACHTIETFFNFPEPNELVKIAQIPGGMYTNMVAQLKQLKLEQHLQSVLKAVPRVRIDAGCVPLVTPTSQIIGTQAVNCILDEVNNRPWYTTKNTQFINLVKGQYGKTPVPIRPEFREMITGSPHEVPYDTSNYKPQPNKILSEYGNKPLIRNEKDQLLMELFPNVAENFLTQRARLEYERELQEKRQEEERLQKMKEETFLSEKKAYHEMTPEEKAERLIYGLYNYKWTTYWEEMTESNEDEQNRSGC
ncbi:MAG: carboxylase [Bacteroidales bacterium]|nr:carboxylase [Bacteroidales bacterium]